MDMTIFYILAAVIGLALLVYALTDLSGGKKTKTKKKNRLVKKVAKNSDAFASIGEGASFDPWLSAEVTEDKIRALIRVRIRFIGNVLPNVPDFSSLLESMATTDIQKAAMKRIWAEEAKMYLGEQSNMRRVSGKKPLNDSLL